MCLTPIIIPNKNYINPVKDKSNRLSHIGQNRRRISCNTNSPTIAVPCGHCAECVFFKQNSAVQRVQMENLNHYLYMFTLTYNEEFIPSICTSDGEEYKYADKRDVYLMFKRIRNKKLIDRPFKRFTCSERGSRCGRPHFHGIISIPKYPQDDEFTPLRYEKLLFIVLLDNWQRNYSVDKRNPVYVNLCTYVRKFRNGKLSTNYDLHYIRPSEVDGSIADVAFYVTKYLFKHSSTEEKLRSKLKINLPPEEYLCVWSEIKSSAYFDNSFGYYDGDRKNKIIDKDIEKHIRKGIEFSYDKFPYPIFINPCTAQTFPLSNFYKKHFYTLSDYAQHYVFKNRENYPELNTDDIDFILNTNDSIGLSELPDYSFQSGKDYLEDYYKIKRGYDRYMKNLSLVESYDFTIDL